MLLINVMIKVALSSTMPVPRDLQTVSEHCSLLQGIIYPLCRVAISIPSLLSCDLHSRDDRGTTPLHWAAAANQPSILQLLLRWNQSTIHYMMQPWLWCMYLHCRHGADRTIRDNDELTAVEHAEVRGHTECAHVLYNYGLRRPSSALSVASQVPLVLCVHSHMTFT